ncbi:MAG: FeoA family protein [Nonlabens sp.]
MTIAELKRGQSATIKNFNEIDVPLKLLEMGCLPGNKITMLQSAPFRDPMYLNINGTHLAIRRETADKITVIKHG